MQQFLHNDCGIIFSIMCTKPDKNYETQVLFLYLCRLKQAYKDVPFRKSEYRPITFCLTSKSPLFAKKLLL